MEIRPIDMPELRAELLEYYSRPATQALWRRLADAGEFWGEGIPSAGMGDRLRNGEIRRLQHEMYWVAPDMVELARSAASTMPGYRLDEADLPSLAGFMYFARPIGFARQPFTDGHEAVDRVVVCSWGPATFLDGEVLWLSIYTERPSAETFASVAGVTVEEARDAQSITPRVLYENQTLIQFGKDWQDFVAPSSFLNGSIGRTVCAAWSLMQQPLARSVDVEPDRAARKRLRRSGHDPKPVRVIELRRPKNSGNQGDGSREYHHQWIVRGHWRQQWYPARQVHRPVWIAPHIKGPEDAPLLGGEKVYAWKR